MSNRKSSALSSFLCGCARCTAAPAPCRPLGDVTVADNHTLDPQAAALPLALPLPLPPLRESIVSDGDDAVAASDGDSTGAVFSDDDDNDGGRPPVNVFEQRIEELERLVVEIQKDVVFRLSTTPVAPIDESAATAAAAQRRVRALERECAALRQANVQLSAQLLSATVTATAAMTLVQHHQNAQLAALMTSLGQMPLPPLPPLPTQTAPETRDADNGSGPV